jgi:DNA-binding PadR family transcriptional regulator
MLILGVVRIFQPVHGYDVRRELLSWHADEWANVAPGSVYHALKKLADEGLLHEVGTEQVGARPARTTYEITAKGEGEFQDLLRRYWWEHKPAIDPFTPAFVFLNALPRREGIAALRYRAQHLRLLADAAEVRLENDIDWEHAAHIVELFRLEQAKARAEADWCDAVADRLDKGELTTADDVALGPHKGWDATRDTSRNIQP